MLAMGLVLATVATARAEAPSDGPSPRRQAELATTVAKKHQRELAIREARATRAAKARAAKRAQAEKQAASIRANSPTYAAVTRNGRGQVKDTYVRMPDGSTRFMTADGYVNDTQVFAQP